MGNSWNNAAKVQRKVLLWKWNPFRWTMYMRIERGSGFEPMILDKFEWLSILFVCWECITGIGDCYCYIYKETARRKEIKGEKTQSQEGGLSGYWVFIENFKEGLKEGSLEEINFRGSSKKKDLNYIQYLLKVWIFLTDLSSTQNILFLISLFWISPNRGFAYTAVLTSNLLFHFLRIRYSQFAR